MMFLIIPRYYQIRTPLNVSCLVMYRFDLEGYSYGVARPLDLVWVGYLYKDQPEPKQTSTIDRNSIAGLQMGTKIGEIVCRYFFPTFIMKVTNYLCSGSVFFLQTF